MDSEKALLKTIDLLDVSNLEGETLRENYLIKKRVGQGGMAWVYLAHHNILDEPMALKILREERLQSQQKVQRFFREIRVQYKLNHPNIVRVFEFIEEQGLLGFAQEWCNSGDLLDWMEKTGVPLSLTHIEELFIPLLDAMHYAHEQGVVHRDLKPQNVLIHEYKGKLHPKVTDFGLAKDEGFERLTEEGAIMGTVHYMPPEQLMETHAVDHRADIYSLGVLLYMMTTARFPFNGSPIEIATAVMKQAPPAPSEAPAALQPVISKSLSKHADNRYQTCNEFKEALLTAIRTTQGVTSAPVVSSPTAVTSNVPSFEEFPPVQSTPTVEDNDFTNAPAFEEVHTPPKEDTSTPSNDEAKASRPTQEAPLPAILPWYKETWFFALSIITSMLIGYILGAFLG